MNAKPAIWLLLGVSLTCATVLDASASEVVPFTRGVLAAGAYVPPSVFVDSDLLPFYSLYPPVYYSHPVKYSYGSTPFAWGPSVCGSGGYYSSGGRLSPGPAVVRNSHAVPTAISAPKSAAEPLRVVNRFVVPAHAFSLGSATIQEARQPSVIHPTALARLSE